MVFRRGRNDDDDNADLHPPWCLPLPPRFDHGGIPLKGHLPAVGAMDYEDDECAVWCARLEEGLRSNFFAALDDATSPRRYEAIEWVENYLIR